MPRKLANVPAQDYDTLQASDSLGDLRLEAADINASHREWKAGRATEGDVTIEFQALPREVNEKTPIGPRLDLRADQGGLMGVGITLIPVPKIADSAQSIRHVVEWGLQSAPAGTRGITSIGEGPQSVEKFGPANTLAMTVFAVGKVKSYPSENETGHDYFGLHWFGNLDRISELARLNFELFNQMAHYFGEAPSRSNRYSIFIRRAIRGFGGTAGPRCYVLEYDANFHKISDREVFSVLAHEMVHNWPDLEDDRQDSEGEPVHWYREGMLFTYLSLYIWLLSFLLFLGIADFFGCTLPYQFGLWSEDDFLESINSKAMQYYTNPMLKLSNKEADKLAWQNSSAQQLPYGRGFMYLMQVNTQIQKESSGERSLLNLVQRLMEKSTWNQPYGTAEWLQLITQELGPPAHEEFHAMITGVVVVPPSDCLPGFSLVRQDQEVLDYGFDTDSLQTRIISGLRANSRAAKAGLKDGDEIVENTFGWQVSQNIQAEMHMVVRRGGSRESLTFTYWPRSWEKVPSWQWVPVEDAGLMTSPFEDHLTVTD